MKRENNFRLEAQKKKEKNLNDDVFVQYDDVGCFHCICMRMNNLQKK